MFIFVSFRSYLKIQRNSETLFLSILSHYYNVNTSSGLFGDEVFLILKVHPRTYPNHGRPDFIGKNRSGPQFSFCKIFGQNFGKWKFRNGPTFSNNIWATWYWVCQGMNFQNQKTSSPKYPDHGPEKIQTGTVFRSTPSNHAQCGKVSSKKCGCKSESYPVTTNFSLSEFKFTCSLFERCSCFNCKINGTFGITFSQGVVTDSQCGFGCQHTGDFT